MQTLKRQHAEKGARRTLRAAACRSEACNLAPRTFSRCSSGIDIDGTVEGVLREAINLSLHLI